MKTTKTIVRRLFDARRAIMAALAVIEQCSRDEHKIRVKERHFQKVEEQGFPVNKSFLVETYHGIVARRFRARESIISAAEVFFDTCDEIDATMSAPQKWDLLGCGHRADPSRNEPFAKMVGLGYEHPIGGECSFGPLKFAGVLNTTPLFRSQHEADREVALAYEERQRHAAHVRSFGIQAIEATRLAARLAENKGFVHRAPETVH
ncbi:hypothetical protein [Paraburkholderia bryophila]|uniref:Uncharacterized protein n=1 Tax=Paraburkholderia bryophila TaxID=420952 RepID=A0A7Z0B9T1_9BURK|nr:hypothetical protein [Paraburkholderia bryophila]NYH24667.1 hypothetical protein [Paraburkholderia bryophila]